MIVYAAVLSVVCRGDDGRPGRRHPRCSCWALTACSPARCAGLEGEGGVDSDELGCLASRHPPGLVVAVSLGASASTSLGLGCLHLDGLWVATQADLVAACSGANVGHQPYVPASRAGLAARTRPRLRGSARAERAGSGVDFGWHGKDGEAQHPSNRRPLDGGYAWHKGVRRAGSVRKEYDEHLLGWPIAPKSDEQRRVLAHGRTCVLRH